MTLKTAISIVDQAMQSRGVDVRKAWSIIQATLSDRSDVPCGDCGKLLPTDMECDNEKCVRVFVKHNKQGY